VGGFVFDGGVGGKGTESARFNERVLCPRNYFVSGIVVRAGLWIDAIDTIRCDRYDRGDRLWVAVDLGGDGGEIVNLLCPDPDPLWGFLVVYTTGAAATRVQVRCRSIIGA